MKILYLFAVVVAMASALIFSLPSKPRTQADVLPYGSREIGIRAYARMLHGNSYPSITTETMAWSMNADDVRAAYRMAEMPVPNGIEHWNREIDERKQKSSTTAH